MHSLLLSALWLAVGFLSGVFGEDWITASRINSTPSSPVSVYLPIVVSRFNADPGDYRDCRLGVDVTRNPITVYDITPFKTGWYVNWQAQTLSGSRIYRGVEHYQTLRIKQDRGADRSYLPTYKIRPALDFSAQGLGPIVRANPGNVWSVGNEPDATHNQDDTMPDMYARIYHDAYYFIKGIDPTAKVTNAALVQPTPLRLLYLDKMLASYRAQFGAPMPVDVWNMHLHIIREVKNDWGADLPPGVDEPVGRAYALRDSVDINIFKSMIMDFRSWLNRNGYGDKPLIITEWGVLMPLWFLANDGVTEEDTLNFVRDAIQFMDEATDPTLGYRADNYRLVQRNAIFSLDDDSTFPSGFDEWGGELLRSTPPYLLTTAGISYRDRIAAGRKPTVDLMPYRVTSVPDRLVTTGEPISPLIKVAIANAGNTVPSSSPEVRFYDVTGGQRVQIGPAVFARPVTGCGTQTEVSFTWPGLSPGNHLLSVEVNPGGQVSEVNLENNRAVFSVYVFNSSTFSSIYLPMVVRG